MSQGTPFQSVFDWYNTNSTTQWDNEATWNLIFAIGSTTMFKLLHLGTVCVLGLLFKSHFEWHVEAREYEGRLELPPFLEPPRRPRSPGSMKETHSRICGATGVRLKLQFPKLYGDWFPVEMSDGARELWKECLYGLNGTTGSICPKWTLSPTTENNDRGLKITLSDHGNSIEVQATLLGYNSTIVASKWVISWPNGEDTLTSIVAVGSWGKNNTGYNWLLTMDCDIGDTVSPDWAIFTRGEIMSNTAIQAIRAIVKGINGLGTDRTFAC